MVAVGRASWRRIGKASTLILLLLMVIGAAAALGRIDVALSGANRPSSEVDVVVATGGIGDIASPARLWDPARSGEVVAGWVAFDDVAKAVPGLVQTSQLRWTYLVLDLVLMFCLAALLAGTRFALLGAVGESPSTGPGGAETRLAVVTSSTLAIGIYLGADLLETLLATLVVPEHSASHGLSRTVGFLALTKFLALGIAVVALLTGVRRDRPVTAAASSGVSWLSALRGQLLITALLLGLLVGLSGDLGRQIDDVLVVAGDRVLPAVVASALMVTTCLAVHLGGRSCLIAYRATPRVRAVSVSSLVRAAGAAVVVGVISFSFLRWSEAVTWSLIIPAGAVGLWALLSGPRAVRDCVRRASDEVGVGVGALRMLAVLTTLPAVALYIAVVRAATSQGTSGSIQLIMIGWSVAALVFAWRLALWTMKWAGTSSRALQGPKPTVALAAFVLVVSFLLTVIAGLQSSEEMWLWAGTPAVVFLCATLLALGVAALVVLSDSVAPRGALALVGFRRTPFLTLVAIWGLLASVVDTQGLYYDARTTHETAAMESPQVAFERWATRMASRDATKPEPADGPPQVPLVFVASAGGGIRSAYWTARTWECAVGVACGSTEDHTSRVFFASGVSGGAVGLAQVRARQMDPGASSGSEWVDTAMSADFLAPSVAAFLFRDLPNSVARLPLPSGDRAASLERAFEASQSGLEADFFGQGSTFPILSFSATSVEDGCRLAVSTVQQAADTGETNCSGPATALPDANGPGSFPVRDAGDYLCDGNGRSSSIRLSTAAFLSARFPYVAPSGGLRQCGDDGAVTSALDGGVFDNSAGAAVTRSWQAVAQHVRKHNRSRGKAPCIVPRLLVIDSHYTSGVAHKSSKRTLQGLGPAVALGNVYEERSSRALAQATRVIRDAAIKEGKVCRLAIDGSSAVAQVYPDTTSGPQGPLGWTLSQSSRTDLTAQVLDACDVHDRHNCVAVRRVQAWFAAFEPPKG